MTDGRLYEYAAPMQDKNQGHCRGGGGTGCHSLWLYLQLVIQSVTERRVSPSCAEDLELSNRVPEAREHRMCIFPAFNCTCSTSRVYTVGKCIKYT